VNQDSVIQAIQEILQAIQGNKPLDEIMQLILKWACTITGSVHGSFLTINHSAKYLEITSVHGPDWTPEIQARKLQLGEGITGRVAVSGEPYLCHDTTKDPNYISWFDYVRCEMAVPIRIQNELWGIINLDGNKPHEYTQVSLTQITLFAQLAASAVDLHLKWNLERRVQQELLESEKLSSLGKLIAGLAHELNNPLTAILGGVSVLAYDIQDPDQKEMLEGIANEAQRAADLIKDLLAFARRQPNKTEIRPIDSIIQETCGIMRHQLKFKNIRLTLGLLDKSPLVNVNPSQISQVLLNLINNAEQAIEMEGRSDGKINIEVEETETSVFVNIIDNGIGMLDATRNSIYDPFFTTKEVGKGTGLGLSISQGIIHTHGGSITCSSGLHAGTTFTIKLPRSYDTPTLSKSLTPSHKTLSTQHVPALQHLRILVVDDEELIRIGLSRYLKSLNHDVHQAGDAQYALALAHDTKFDLIISDIRMPRMSGIELYYSLIEIDPQYRKRFIFITGDLVASELLAQVRATQCPLVEKPFNFQSIFELLPQPRASGRSTTSLNMLV